MCSSLKKAYTLLEQAIAISILAFLVMVMVMISDYQYDVSFYNDTEEKINQIEKSLISHMIRYSKDSNVVFGNPLPCPALITNSINLSTFGKSNSQYDDAGGDCLGSYKTDISNLNNYYYGMVPVRTLGLPDDYAFDSWGRRFLFLINKDIFKSRNQDLLTDDYSTSLYFIISYGKNGYGAYGKNGSLLSDSLASTYEKHNILSSLSINDIQDMPRQNNYDDIVVNKTLLQFVADLSGGVIYSSSECSTLQSYNESCAYYDSVNDVSEFSCVFR
ncbi:MAG: hypothetical protein ISQ32_00760 [Rickettsiales bacterium]|nr:hypothetical protein [Rickettsiales bacterium]